MTIVPLDLASHASAEALESFLRECQELVIARHRPALVSISVGVSALDPLAVLESIFDDSQPYFYCERPNVETAISGAEIAVQFRADGPDRFNSVRDFVASTLEGAIGVGAVDAPFGGPHFFTAFTFEDSAAAAAPFPAAWAFVPRWQVARAGEVTTAVANLHLDETTDVPLEAQRIWRAHATFQNFTYSTAKTDLPNFPEAAAVALSELQDRVKATGDYLESVRQAHDYIVSGLAEKIVIARAKDYTAPAPWHPLHILSGLRERFPDCFAFSLSNGEGMNFFGASPERLLRVSQGKLETEALAGSARRGRSASEDAALGAQLLGDEKELREHAHVVAAVAQRLRDLGLAPQFAASPGLRRLANVQHLLTAIQAELPARCDPLEIVAALHPTPAVGGVPSAAARAAIAQIESFSRGLYTGTIGWVNSRGGGEFFVGLRSGLLEANRIRIYAGAGIVAGSIPEKELAETELKFNAMLNALSAA